MASDTSLVFNLLGKDRISSVLDKIKGGFRSAGQEAERSMEQASVSTDRLDRQIKEVERDLAKLSAEFALTGDKTLFGKISRDRSLLNSLQRIRSEVQRNNEEADRSTFDRLGDQFRDAASGAGSVIGQLGSLGSTVGSVTSSLWGIAAAIGGVTAALAAIGPGLALAGGALGSLPGLIGGGAAALGTLKLGLFGLSDEYKRLTTATGGGGGGATKAAKDFTAANRAVHSAVEEVARAERDLTQAQQDALAAQQAINAARETASKRMRDQALDLQTAQLDQKDAADAVTQAQTDLNQALANGDPVAANKATEALQRAQIQLQQAKNRTDDLTEANTENARKGVEGSDEVVQAKKREAEARQHVADAQQAEVDAEQRLADARKNLADQKSAPAGGGGGGGAAQQVTQLAPAARSFLNTILALRPAFTQLRLDVQEKLFAGLSSRLQTLAQRWLPQLHTTLGGFASTFNGIAKELFASASKRTFIENMAAGAEGVRHALADIGHAVGGPLVDAFGRLAAASAPFIEKLGSLIAGVITKVSQLIIKADNAHKLKSFFQGAADTLQKVWDVGTQVAKIIGQVIAIIYPSAKQTGDGVLDAANNALKGISDWLKDPKNQAKIREIADDIKQWTSELKGFIAQLKGLKPIVGPIFKLIGGSINSSSMLLHGTTVAVHSLIDAFKAVGRAVPGVWNGLKNGFKSAVNFIIRGWNNLSFTLGGFSFLGLNVPSFTVSTPDIPYLAKGGDVQQGGMAVVGERGPELLNLPRGAQVTPLGPSGGRGGAQVVVFDVRGADTEFGRLLLKILRNQPAVTATAKKHLGIA